MSNHNVAHQRGGTRKKFIARIGEVLEELDRASIHQMSAVERVETQTAFIAAIKQEYRELQGRLNK